jgi:hypothetical protein
MSLLTRGERPSCLLIQQTLVVAGFTPKHANAICFDASHDACIHLALSGSTQDILMVRPKRPTTNEG